VRPQPARSGTGLRSPRDCPRRRSNARISARIPAASLPRFRTLREARTLPATPAERNVQFRTAIRIHRFNPALPSRAGTGVERAAPMALSTSVVSADPASHETDLLALLVREGDKLGAVDASLDGLLSRCAKEEEFTGKEGQVLTLHTHGKLGAQRVAAIGIGKEKDEDRTLEQLRLAASRA